MHARSEKTNENKSRSVANGLSQHRDGSASVFQFADERPAVLVQRRLQAMAASSAQAKQGAPRQSRTNHPEANGPGKESRNDNKPLPWRRPALSGPDAVLQAVMVIQRAITRENVQIKAEEFIQHHQTEAENIAKVNMLLQQYSRLPSLDVYETAQAQILVARENIRAIHIAQAALLGEYSDGASEEAAKQEFLRRIIPGFEERDAALFHHLAGKIQKIDAKQDDEVFKTLKARYLSFIVQGLGTKTGKARLQEFDQLLGRRDIRIDQIGVEYGAGFADDKTDEPKSQKQEDRLPLEDQKLLAEVQGNIPEFIRRRFGDKAGRTPNAKSWETGDIAVYLEKYQKLFPMYIGQNKSKNVELFTAPLFTAMHHETGHHVNYLKGVGGGKNKYKDPRDGPLKDLTDEEEVYNISIDRYSDKAMSGELGLPERIAHGSYLGIDASREEWEEEDVHSSMEKWKKQSGQESSTHWLRDLQVAIDRQPITAKYPAFHQAILSHLDQVRAYLHYVGEAHRLYGPERQQLADGLAWSLDKLEHKIYDRMGLIQKSNHALIKTDEPELKALGDCLDAIQVDHRGYIQIITANHLDLWVSGSLDEKRAANRDWQALLANNSGIRIDDTAAPEFQNETRANIARLLSRKQGRKLVHALVGENNALHISTPEPAKVSKMRDYFSSQGMQGEKLENELKGMFGGQAGPVDHGKESALPGGMAGLQRGPGSRSTMSMGTGIKDSEGLSLDRKGKLILSPNFLELGHEMIHALQNIRGANVKGINGKAYTNSSWDNMSEESVIAGTPEMQGLLGDDFITENMLREDHNLGVRFGHSTEKTLVNAVREKFLEIARNKAWDAKGGHINDETPAGILFLRLQLAPETPDWQLIKVVMHEKTDRFALTKFVANVPKEASNFYAKVEQFCDLYPVITKHSDMGLLRHFLDSLQGYNPV